MAELRSDLTYGPGRRENLTHRGEPRVVVPVQRETAMATRTTAHELPPGRNAPGGFGFLRDVEARSRSRVSACLQCHKCSSGCPVAGDADLRSSQLLRLVALGAEEEVLSSKAIWLCSSCAACTARCPMGIDVARVMDTLRILAVARRSRLATTRDHRFARAFLASVRRHGRVFELGMLTAYKLTSGRLFEDLELGLELALHRKLRLWPRRVRHVLQMRQLFRRARHEEERR